LPFQHSAPVSSFINLATKTFLAQHTTGFGINRLFSQSHTDLSTAIKALEVLLGKTRNRTRYLLLHFLWYEDQLISQNHLIHNTRQQRADSALPMRVGHIPLDMKDGLFEYPNYDYFLAGQEEFNKNQQHSPNLGNMNHDGGQNLPDFSLSNQPQSLSTVPINTMTTVTSHPSHSE